MAAAAATGNKKKGKVFESGAESHLIYDFYVKTTVVNTRRLMIAFKFIYLFNRPPYSFLTKLLPFSLFFFFCFLLYSPFIIILVRFKKKFPFGNFYVFYFEEYWERKNGRRRNENKFLFLSRKICKWHKAGGKRKKNRQDDFFILRATEKTNEESINFPKDSFFKRFMLSSA